MTHPAEPTPETPDVPDLPGTPVTGAAPDAVAVPGAPARWPDDVRTVLRVVAFSLAVGVVAGLVWWLVAPRAELVVGGDGGVELVDGGGKAFIGADAWFAIIGAVAGLLVASVSCWRWRRTGIGLSLGVAIGGLAGSGVAWALGQALGGVDVASAAAGQPAGTVIEAGLRLRATGVTMAWPIVGLMAVLAVAASYGLDEPPEPLLLTEGEPLVDDPGVSPDRSGPPSPG